MEEMGSQALNTARIHIIADAVIVYSLKSLSNSSAEVVLLALPHHPAFQKRSFVV
jgi:hypothetical protein